jgi:hypothetical protein
MDKSEAKNTYKRAKRPMGVYRIRNTRNDKSYIGCGTDLPAKINRHKAELKFGSHRNRELQEEWNLFGGSSLQFEVLDELDYEQDSQASPSEELQVLKEMWMSRLEKEGHSVASL